MTFLIDDLTELQKNLQTVNLQEWKLYFQEILSKRKVAIFYDQRIIIFDLSHREEVLEGLSNRCVSYMVPGELYSTYFTDQEIESLKKVQ